MPFNQFWQRWEAGAGKLCSGCSACMTTTNNTLPPFDGIDRRSPRNVGVSTTDPEVGPERAGTSPDGSLPAN